jgi:hypothetical protein
MTQPRTVYFETDFYRELASLPAREIARVVTALDERKIRTVLSAVVLEELLQDPCQPERDARLADAMLFLDQRSLCLEPGLSWGMLKLPDEARHALTALHRRLGPLRALGDALGLLAGAPDAATRRTQLQAQLNREVARLGLESLEVPGDAKLGWLLDVALPLLKGAGVDLGGLKTLGLGRAATDRLRDVRRAAEFVRCAAEIDRLQVGREQLERMRGAGHPLVEAGLLGRCFWSESRAPLEILERA